MSMRGSPHATLFFACFFFISVESLAYDCSHAQQTSSSGNRRFTRSNVSNINVQQVSSGSSSLERAHSHLLYCSLLLLRNHEPSDQDRTARRERYRRNRDHQEHDSTAASPGHSSFGDKLRGMWAIDTVVGTGVVDDEVGVAGSKLAPGDEWEINSDHGEEHGGQQPMQPFSRSFQDGRYGPQVPEMDSPLSDAESYAPMHYKDPYATGPLHVTSPQRVTFARSQSPFSQSSSPRSPGSHRDASVDDEEVRPPDHRHFSTQSSISVRTFEGGTKFIESF
ncbi:hypothetical protein F4604DRAFT_1255701 [Suillus subluteus]|nr:hypothetical protein F4604DRAFT_1255701 [Suillus subluteus]